MNLLLRSIYYGWWVVVSSFFIHGMAFGFYWLGFSVFFLPLVDTLGISRAAASLPFTIRGIIGIAEAPLVGVLVDRLGPAKILIVCALLGGLGYVLLSFVNSYLMFMIVFLVVISIGMLPFDLPTTAAVGRWFNRKRGQAMSLAFMGFPFGGMVLIPLMALAVDHFGWRVTAIIAGIIIWAVVVPLATRLYNSPESRGLQADGDIVPNEVPLEDTRTIQTQSQIELTPRQAMLTPVFWVLTLSCGLRSTVFLGLGIHLVGVMAWKGVDETTSGLLIGAYAFMWMGSTFVMGWAGERWPKATIAGIPGFLGSLAMVLILLIGSVEPWQMALLLMLWATNEGSWALNFTILADIFGSKHFGANRGAMIGVMNSMAAGAPLYSGWVYDTTGSYAGVIIPAAALLGVAGAMNYSVPWFARWLPNSSIRQVV